MATGHTETVDKYLEAIYYIAGEGEVVRPSRLAYWLSVSAPTVSNALVRLKRDGWIDIGSDRSVTLTDSGTATATSLVRRHRILERWLTDVLGFDWASADIEADRISSAISDAVVDRIDTTMGSPSTCPHGNIIPGRDAHYGSTRCAGRPRAGYCRRPYGASLKWPNTKHRRSWRCWPSTGFMRAAKSASWSPTSDRTTLALSVAGEETDTFARSCPVDLG